MGPASVPVVPPLPNWIVPPAMIVVVPLKVLAPVRVSTDAPDCFRLPVPLIRLATVCPLDQSKFKVPPAPMLILEAAAIPPVVSLLPNCKVPALMFVMPV